MSAPTHAPPAQPPADDDIDAASDPGAEIETRRSVVAPAEHGQRLDRVLVGLAPEFSRSYLQSLVERGCVRVDGVVSTQSSRRLKVGQGIEIDLVPTAESLAFRPQAMALRVVFEDEQVIVLDKPAGLVVHPAAGNWSGTLLNGLLAHHAGAARLPRAGIVHRLDKDTSGVMMVGKTLEAVTALVRDLAARRVQRSYLALAHGTLGEDDIVVDAPIGRDPRSRVRMAVVASGRPARTDVRCVARHERFSALQCRLHTGRTHQIRVHLAHVGHPLVGDALYGGSPALGMVRQALHAARLAFEHPVSRASLVFDVAAPDDFERAWQSVAGRAAVWRD